MSTILLLLLLSSSCQMSTQSRASVTIKPDSSQFFEYEEVSVRCEQFSPGEWTVWRYTNDGEELSQCGSGWGGGRSSTCEMKTVKLANTGVYWCESRHKDSSNVINVTVCGGDRAVLKSPALPVTEGQDVELSCKLKNGSDRPAQFFKNGSSFKNSPTGRMTIKKVSKSDEGAYKCHISGYGESPESWLLMKDDSEPASLTVEPDTSQLTEYENLLLNCVTNHSLTEWKIKRWLQKLPNGPKMSVCGPDWGAITNSGCVLQSAKQLDSGVYWCESPSRQRSNSVNISIYSDKPVILHSPVLPVMEGDNVTLLCKTKTTHAILSADFYKDGSLIRTESTGHMTIHNVTRSDEGLYKCNISGLGESPSSWLYVRAPASGDSSHTFSALSLLSIIRHLVVFCPYFISTVLMLSLFRHRPTGRIKLVSMTMSPLSNEDHRLDRLYDDVMADVTTEHHF